MALESAVNSFAAESGCQAAVRESPLPKAYDDLRRGGEEDLLRIHRQHPRCSD